MNIINVEIDFTNGKNKLTGINLITGDYASTKMIFQFDRTDGTKVLEIKNPLGELVYIGEILNNEVVLAAVENGHNYSIFSSEGRYIYEVSLYNGDSKLTSVKGELPVAKEQVIIDGEIVEPYLPIFDELIQDINNKIEEVDGKIDDVDSKIEIIDGKIEEVNTAIEETNNLNIDVSDKVNKEVTITLTKKDNTTKSVKISDGLSLQFMWQGTSLGIKTDDMQDYVFVDLQGIQGVPGPQGEPFRIKKTYPSVQAMNDDFNNMNYGDYVMIASSVEVQDNAKLYTRGEQEWIFITDFSGATGIKGETGATPSISIGSVTSGATPSVTRTGTDENPVLNFVLQKGDKGDTGNTGDTGATGNGISSIEKTSETLSQTDYRINYTNGEHFDYSVENGEVTQSQLDEVIAENDYLNSIIDQIVPKVTGSGEYITLNDTIEAKMDIDLYAKLLSQITNLFNNDIEQGAISEGADVTSTNRIRTKGYIEVIPSTQLYIGFSGCDEMLVSYYNSSKTFVNAYGWASGNANVSIPANISYIRVAFRKSDNSNITPSSISNVQIGNVPNPQYPQDIHIISGSNTIKVESNLFDGAKEKIYFNSSKQFVTENNSKTTDYKPASEGDTFTLTSQATSNGVVIASFDENYNCLLRSATSGTTITHTCPTGTKYIIGSNNNGMNTNTMLNKGSSPLPYTPYTSEEANIDLGDIEYCKIGNYEDKFKQSTGKNKITFNNLTGNTNIGVTSSFNNSEFKLNGTTSTLGNLITQQALGITLPAGTYFMSYKIASGTFSNIVDLNDIAFIIRKRGTGTAISTVTLSKIVSLGGSEQRYGLSFTISEATEIDFYAYCNTSGIVLNNLVFQAQLETGNSMTEYEPYLTKGSWYLKENIGKVVYNGSEEGWTGNSPATGVYRFLRTLDGSYNVGSARSKDYILSNYFHGVTDNTIGGMYQYQTQIYFNMDSNSYSSVNDFKTWLSTHNTDVYYVLAIPTYTPITGTLANQLDNIKSKLLSQKGQTNISQVNNDLPFEISVSALGELNV